MSTSRSCSLYEFVSGMLLALLRALQVRGRADGPNKCISGLEQTLTLLNRCMTATSQWLVDLSEMCRKQDPAGYAS